MNVKKEKLIGRTHAIIECKMMNDKRNKYDQLL